MPARECGSRSKLIDEPYELERPRHVAGPGARSAPTTTPPIAASPRGYDRHMVLAPSGGGGTLGTVLAACSARRRPATVRGGLRARAAREAWCQEQRYRRGPWATPHSPELEPDPVEPASALRSTPSREGVVGLVGPILRDLA